MALHGSLRSPEVGAPVALVVAELLWVVLRLVADVKVVAKMLVDWPRRHFGAVAFAVWVEEERAVVEVVVAAGVVAVDIGSPVVVEEAGVGACPCRKGRLDPVEAGVDEMAVEEAVLP